MEACADKLIQSVIGISCGVATGIRFARQVAIGIVAEAVSVTEGIDYRGPASGCVVLVLSNIAQAVSFPDYPSDGVIIRTGMATIRIVRSDNPVQGIVNIGDGPAQGVGLRHQVSFPVIGFGFNGAVRV